MQSRSESLFDQARDYIPGGVNSPVRAFSGVGGCPIFIERSQGAFLFDVDGQRYIDYVGSWGPMILGHNHPSIRHAMSEAIENGLSFGTPTEIEVRMAKKICTLLPSIEKVRMVNSGTEATMSAIRLARGYTHKTKIIKFTGCYHGHVDSLLVKAGSGALTLGQPDSPGIPKDLTQHTLICTYNDLASVEQAFRRFPNDIAGVIVEPVAGNMNCIPPQTGFLQGLRDLCDRYHSLLIFDEVMTGFRVGLGGAQRVYNVMPDLTTLGKIIGAGLPVGAFGGRQEVMSALAPEGPVYQAGTLSGNPIAMTVGLTVLNQLDSPDFYQKLDKQTRMLTQGLQEAALGAGVPFTTHQVGGMFGLFFTRLSRVNTYKDVLMCDTKQFQTFFHLMLKEGIYLAPSAFEAGFMSAAHDDDLIHQTIASAARCFRKLVQY